MIWRKLLELLKITLLLFVCIFFFTNTEAVMTIKMPVVIGIHAHPSLYAKVDEAIADKDFPVILDCENTTFMTSMFYRFAITVHKKVKAANGVLKIINVNQTLYDAVVLCNIHMVLNVFKKGDHVG